MIQLMLDDRYASMPWDEIDTVVFDVGNVLLLWDPVEVMTRTLPDRPDLYPELTIRVFKSPYWCMRDRESATVEEVIAAMAAGAPELEPFIRRIMYGWKDLPEIPEGIETVNICKAHGKRVYALTNYADKEFAYACSQHAFFAGFDGFMVSGREHVVKPGREIYELMASRFDFVPSRTLFIDDSPANIEGALHCGWQGICFNRAGKLHDFFKE